MEIDLGTMSHARLRQKAELYAAYTESNAWHGRHLFLPALLFLTTTDIRAGKFLKALAGILAHGLHSKTRRAFTAGAAGVAWAPHRLLDSACLMDVDGHTGLALTDVLSAARAPYEKTIAREQEEQEAEDAKRRRLREQPSAMREHLRANKGRLHEYALALGPEGEQTFDLLLASEEEPTPEERAALKAIAHDLDQALPGLWPRDIPKPGATATSEAQLLAEHYRATQTKHVQALAAEHPGNLPALQRARGQLRNGRLLSPDDISTLPGDVKRDSASHVTQHELATAYLAWREHAARQLVRQAGPLGRLTRRPEEFYTQLDHQTLKVCRRCQQLVFPPARDPDSHGPRPEWACHYCHNNHGMDPFQGNLNTRKEAQQ